MANSSVEVMQISLLTGLRTAGVRMSGITGDDIIKPDNRKKTPTIYSGTQVSIFKVLQCCVGSFLQTEIRVSQEDPG